MEEKGNAYNVLAGKREDETTKKTRCRWKDNIKVGLKEIR
jgi:hypothetical protein